MNVSASRSQQIHNDISGVNTAADIQYKFSDDFDGDGELFKARLREVLNDVQHDGKFFSFHTASQYVNPGLYINDIGSVGLPLSERDAKAVAGVCKQSPFGKGDETVIDENIRKTWELDTTEFACRNPDWQHYLDTLARQAVEDMGVQVAAYPQRYKLLLYEKGAFFKIHRDTEKVPGMFGTLVVCLPSEHTGGDVNLTHNNKTHVIGTAKTSAFGLSTLA